MTFLDLLEDRVPDLADVKGRHFEVRAPRRPTGEKPAIRWPVEFLKVSADAFEHCRVEVFCEWVPVLWRIDALGDQLDLLLGMGIDDLRQRPELIGDRRCGRYAHSSAPYM